MNTNTKDGYHKMIFFVLALVRLIQAAHIEVAAARGCQQH